MPIDALPQGRCDLHCHLLYGVDDGAKTLGEALEMARVLVQLGYSVVAPSPHARKECAPESMAQERLDEVREALVQAGVNLLLFPNGENFLLEDGFFSPERNASRRALGEG